MSNSTELTLFPLLILVRVITVTVVVIIIVVVVIVMGGKQSQLSWILITVWLTSFLNSHLFEAETKLSVVSKPRSLLY